MKKNIKLAFSLVELMVTLVVVAVLSAAMVPVITKKLKSKDITIGGAIGTNVGAGSSGGDYLTSQECKDLFGVNCERCFSYACDSCVGLTCNPSEFFYQEGCRCVNCSDYDPNCKECNEQRCLKCASGYGLAGTGCTTTICSEGEYSNGDSGCLLCEAGYRCIGGQKIACELDEYSNQGALKCTKCSLAISGCERCTSATSCTKCEAGFSLKGNSCELSVNNIEYTVAGTYSLAVPDGVTQMKVTLVSGGAGGGAGAIVKKTDTFVISGNGNIPTVDDNNVLHTSSTGLFDWTIPSAIKGTNVLVSACGGGGASKNASGNTQGLSGGRGGDGGAFLNSIFPMPNQTTLKIQIGGAGGSGVNNVGAGTDPLFNQSNSGGGAGGWGAYSGSTGSLVYSGTGTTNNYCYLAAYQWYYGEVYCWTGIGAAGGNPTMFLHPEYAKTQAWVAPGGGGGATNSCYYKTHWDCTATGTGGGGGGGIGGGTGGGANAGAGGAGYGAGAASAVFGGNYCTADKNGAMRITYSDKPNGGTGGGAGHMVVNQLIEVIPNDTLTIVVGRGGAGGVAGYLDESGNLVESSSGEGANSEMISKIINSKGVILLTSAPNISIMGNSGGNPNGTTVGERGYISNGLSISDLGAVYNYSNDSGAIASGTTGGSGGQTYLGDDSVLHCAAKQGSVLGIAAPNYTSKEYGGCGGAGGGAGADGGSGAQGYVYLEMIKEAE